MAYLVFLGDDIAETGPQHPPATHVPDRRFRMLFALVVMMAVGEDATAAVEEETDRPFEAGCSERRLRGAAHRP
jgi:hypothetical protein